MPSHSKYQGRTCFCLRATETEKIKSAAYPP
jgi:hypothetical protein